MVTELTAEPGNPSLTVVTLAGERNTALSDFDALRSSLNDTQSSTTTQQADLEAASEFAAEKNDQINDFTVNNTALSKYLEAKSASLTGDQREGPELRSQIAEHAATITMLAADLTARGAKITRFECNVTEISEAHSATVGQVETLTRTIQKRDAQVPDLKTRADAGGAGSRIDRTGQKPSDAIRGYGERYLPY